MMKAAGATAPQKTPVRVTIKSPEKKTTEPKKEQDVFRDTWIRNFGATNEYGTAMKNVVAGSSNAFVRNIPKFSFIPVAGYIIASVADKTRKGEDGTGKKPSIKMGVREALYQGVVSLVAPTLVVDGVLKGTDKLAAKLAPKLPKMPKLIEKGLEKVPKLGKMLKGSKMPAKVAQATLAILVVHKCLKPIDKLTEKVFNHTVDKALGIKKKES